MFYLCMGAGGLSAGMVVYAFWSSLWFGIDYSDDD